MVMTTMAALIPVLMVKVLPAFVAMFEDSGIQLPLPTRMVMGFSDWMIDYLYILMIISLGIWVGLYLAYKSQAGRRVFDLMALKMPGLSVLNKKSLTALFSDTLALLITSGVPVFQSLEILKEVLGNTIAKEEMDHTLNQVRQGNTISSTLVDSKIYPKMMVSMIRIGEETGALDEMLIKTSQYYKKEVDAAIGQVTLFIEPILILFIALVIGGIMLAVLLPTFTMATELM